MLFVIIKMELGSPSLIQCVENENCQFCVNDFLFLKIIIYFSKHFHTHSSRTPCIRINSVRERRNRYHSSNRRSNHVQRKGRRLPDQRPGNLGFHPSRKWPMDVERLRTDFQRIHRKRCLRCVQKFTYIHTYLLSEGTIVANLLHSLHGALG